MTDNIEELVYIITNEYHVSWNDKKQKWTKDGKNISRRGH